MVTQRQRLRARLAAEVEEHAGKRTGLSNEIVGRMTRLIGAGKNFAGVHAADSIPINAWAARPNFSMIVNLGRWKDRRQRNKVGHFISIVGK